jgi:hypothetical protein
MPTAQVIPVRRRMDHAPVAQRIRRALWRGVVVASVAVAGLSAALWAGSGVFGSIGIFSLGQGTSLHFSRGTADVRHFYAYNIAAPIPKDQWHTTALSRGWVNPPGQPPWTLPMFEFSSGNVAGIGMSSSGGSISPASYWLLRVPLWATMLPGVLAATWIAVNWDPGREQRRRGFAVAPAPRGTPA